MLEQNIRWKQRFQNYKNMFVILKTNIEDSFIDDLTELEQIGISKSFELCFELLWKMLKDYLEYETVEIGMISPKNIIKVSASSGLLEEIGVEGDILLKFLKIRNELVHVYDYEKFKQVLFDIKDIAVPEMNKIYNYFEGMI